MLLIIFILFPKIGRRYNTGHQFCFFCFFFKEWGFHETIYLHFIFNNNKEIIPYMYSITTWVVRVHFHKHATFVAIFEY